MLKPGVPFTPSLKDVIDDKCGRYNVSWEKPTSDSGGGPITAYRAQVRMQSEDSWRDCTTSVEKRSCVFKGLVNESKYHVRVQAINRKGPSDWYYGSFDAVYTGEVYSCKKSPTPFEKDKKKKVRSEKVKRKYAISKFEELRKVQSVSTKLLMKLATLS